MRAAGDMGHVRVGNVADGATTHLALGDGPLFGTSGAISATAVLWFAAAAVLVIAGLLAAPRGVVRRSLAVAAASGVVVALVYLAGVSSSAPRFLLPSYALMSLPIGLALEASAARAALRPVVVAFALLWVASHGVVAVDVTAAAKLDRSGPEATGRQLRELVPTDRCLVVGVSWPQVAYAAACGGIRGDPVVAAATSREALHAGTRLFVVVQHGMPAPALPLRPFFSSGRLDVYELVPGAALSAVP